MTMLIRLGFLAAVCLLAAGEGRAQWVRYHMERGDAKYDGQEYEEAERQYRESLKKGESLPQANHNIGNSLYRRGKYDESINEFAAAAEQSLSPEARASSRYNAGNAHMKAGRYREAVQSYAQSLKVKPDDEDAKYNLSYALEKLRQQQQQQQQNQQQDKNQQDQNNRQQDQQQQQQQQDQQQQKQQQPQDQQQARDQQRQQQKQMAQADAERILDVLKNNEKEVQKKLRKRPASRVRVEKDW